MKHERTLIFLLNDPSIGNKEVVENITMSTQNFAPHNVIVVAEDVKAFSGMQVSLHGCKLTVADWVDVVNSRRQDLVLLLESAERYVGDGDKISVAIVAAKTVPVAFSFPVAFQYGCPGLRRTDGEWGKAVTSAMFTPDRDELTSDELLDCRQGLFLDTKMAVGFIHTTACDVRQFGNSLIAGVVPRGRYATKFEHDAGAGATVAPVGVLRPILVCTAHEESRAEFQFLAYFTAQTDPDAVSIMSALRPIRSEVRSAIACYVDHQYNERQTAYGLSQLQMCADRSALAWETLDGWTAAFVVEHALHPYGKTRLGMDGAIIKRAGDDTRDAEDFWRPFPADVVAGPPKNHKGDHHPFENRMWEEFGTCEEDLVLAAPIQRPGSLTAAVRAASRYPDSETLRVHLVNLIADKCGINMNLLSTALNGGE